MLIIVIWIVLFLIFGFEYWALNFHMSSSILLKMQNHGWIAKSFLINPDPGRPLSLYLGWFGLSLMIIMNVYSIRKRIGGLRNFGKLSSWLDFHVLCGLVGPTLIFFHCNFKVRGLVAISFWSMVVSFASGIIGRYFYLQLSGQKSEFDAIAEKILSRLDKKLQTSRMSVSTEERDKVLQLALAHAGVPADVDGLNPFSALFLSLSGDLRMFFQSPIRPARWPIQTQIILKSYALVKRRALFLESFQRLMGYWHTFHFPFAIFMYIAAVIHVISALVFGV